MDNTEFSFAATDRLNERKGELEQFLDVAFLPEDRPFFVSDEATYYDIDAGDDDGVIERCAAHYNVDLQPRDLSKPIWQVLDYLASRRRAD